MINSSSANTALNNEDRPPHPGLILERDFMKPSGLTPAMLAEKLGEKWNEAKITAIIEGKEGISERSAKDLSAFFGTTSQFWDDLQQLYFQWAKHKREVEKGPIKEKKKRGKKG